MTVFVYKTCKDCGESKVRCRQFYRHPTYRDGYMNSCKDCKRQQSREAYELKWHYYRAKQSRRAATPKYRAQRAAYAKTLRGREVHRAANRRYRRFKALEARA
jgi:hypothetical protein